MLVLVLCMQVDVKSLKRLQVESIVSVCANIMLSICPYECYTSHISVHVP